MSEHIEIELRWSRLDSTTAVAIRLAMPTPQAASDLLDALTKTLRRWVRTHGPADGGREYPTSIGIRHLVKADYPPTIDGYINFIGGCRANDV